MNIRISVYTRRALSMRDFSAAQGQRLTKFQLLFSSPDFSPIEYLWKEVKKVFAPLKYLAAVDSFTATMDKTLYIVATRASEIFGMMEHYC